MTFKTFSAKLELIPESHSVGEEDVGEVVGLVLEDESLDGDHPSFQAYLRSSYSDSVLRGIVIRRRIPENIQCLLVLLVDFGKVFRLFRIVQLLCSLVRLPATV